MSLAMARPHRPAEWQNILPATPSTSANGTLMNASATPGTYGSWVTLATANYDVYGFWMFVSSNATSATATNILLDISWGTASSPENKIFEKWQIGYRDNANLGGYVQWIPIFIPKGAVIQGRIVSSIANKGTRIVLWLNNAASAVPGPLYTTCDTYGTDGTAANARGTAITPGSTGTESSDVNIGSTTTRAYGAVMISFGGPTATTTMTAIGYHFELRFGSATKCEWYVASHTTEAIQGPWPPTPYGIPVPSGTQLAIRAEGSGVAVEFTASLHCFY